MHLASVSRSTGMGSIVLNGTETRAALLLPPLLAHIKRLMKPHSNSTAAKERHSGGSSGFSTQPGESCRGYYDVMGQYDHTFNCSINTFLYCCGTCHYRFCCGNRENRVDQDSCKNYDAPDWGMTTISATQANSVGSEYDPSKDQTNSTIYIICGVISFTLAVGLGAKIAFNKASHRPRPRDINVPRALVDILRHQTAATATQERNNSTNIGSNTQDNGPNRTLKNHYVAPKPVKTNHNNHHHNFVHLPVSSPKHSATMDRPSRLNNMLATSATLKHNSLLSSRSFHNLSHLPPSYENAIKSDLNRYCSLKRLADKDLEDYYSKRRHLAELTARGTLPLHVMKMNYARDSYPSDTVPNPRRVMSQDRILSDEQSFTVPRNRVVSHERLLSREALHSQERLLSPDRTLRRFAAPERLPRQKAASQTNVCVSTPLLDRHHMIKMNSHPTSSSSPKACWDSGNHTINRRQAFTTKRQNTVEQLHFIPGHHPSQHLRTGSKNEVTV
ncbi:protein shisa-6 [Latimeria chalumnae]|uniref:protein shisa-6 n=1 Tax=Latimeria chalumnae TaxID=7897 RepID=UPI0006D90B8E|nr:PREDICTED: protein shisa-6 homolog [Latimeria chalumnae]|eukprot:XP_006000692.2 PREDICTED: protein shisa-6 homolog [Latimeria chalumnae]